MSDDLVRRLRTEPTGLGDEAVAEIERLRAEREAWEEQAKTHAAEVEMLKACLAGPDEVAQAKRQRDLLAWRVNDLVSRNQTLLVELERIATEMGRDRALALLRELTWQRQPDGVWCCICCGRSKGEGHNAVCRLDEVLR